ncbi:hypothetical protein BKA62DRAFT_757180 [Auriculariales sp. MPI-PUGE-AT-0066]|nr:hypothetical protein BKA62DRAFT_757180 [Auriculariales sp. MPI-PUGE-AT-0066]
MPARRPSIEEKPLALIVGLAQCHTTLERLRLVHALHHAPTHSLSPCQLAITLPTMTEMVDSFYSLLPSAKQLRIINLHAADRKICGHPQAPIFRSTSVKSLGYSLRRGQYALLAL